MCPSNLFTLPQLLLVVILVSGTGTTTQWAHPDTGWGSSHWADPAADRGWPFLYSGSCSSLLSASQIPPDSSNPSERGNSPVGPSLTCVLLSIMTAITLSLIQESTQLSLSWTFFLYWIKCPQCSLLTLPFCNRFNVSTPVFLLLVSSLMRKPTNLRAAYAIVYVF